MNKKRSIVTWVVLAFLAISSSGCALIGTALSVAASYAIYQATQK